MITLDQMLALSLSGCTVKKKKSRHITSAHMGFVAV